MDQIQFQVAYAQFGNKETIRLGQNLLNPFMNSETHSSLILPGL